MTEPTNRRIGVLTFHRCINYGSYWQARCLVEGLRERGHNAVLLDHHSDSVNRAEWRVALQPVWDGNTTYRQDYRAKTRRFFEAFETLPLSQPFPLDAPEQSEPYDLVFVGSDEVWNARHPWYGEKKLFFGEDLPTRYLATYAASMGNQSSAIEAHWAERIKRFDAVAVRDRNSQELVGAVLGYEPPLVLDPVLQFAHLVPKQPLANRRYTLVYGHSFPDWLIARVTRWAREHGRHLLSVGYHNPWADEQLIDAGPLEFAALVQGADALVTNFFHGCVFALINNKPFATAPSDYRSNKVRDLVAALGAEQHKVTAETGDDIYNKILIQPLDAEVATRIAALRQVSEAYLDGVLA